MRAIIVPIIFSIIFGALLDRKRIKTRFARAIIDEIIESAGSFEMGVPDFIRGVSMEANMLLKHSVHRTNITISTFFIAMVKVFDNKTN